MENDFNNAHCVFPRAFPWAKINFDIFEQLNE